MQTYYLSAGTAAAVLEVCTLSRTLSLRRNLLLAEVLHWQCSSCLDLWKKTVSVD